MTEYENRQAWDLPSWPEMYANLQTLQSPTIDRKLARVELQNSPLYRNLLVSPDLKTTAIQVNFWTDAVYTNLIARRDRILIKQTLSPQQIQLMKLLQVPTMELEMRIKEEMEINPALEEGREVLFPVGN